MTISRKIANLHAVYKLAISLLCGIVCFVILLGIPMELLTRMMISWDIFAIVLIGLSFITFRTLTSGDIRRIGAQQDESRFVIFVLVLIATVSSLLAIIVLLTSKSSGGLVQKEIKTAIYISGVVCSWFLLHTMFTLRYAHMYYSNSKTLPGEHAAGLIFPEEEKPDYFDFAYFSFVVGMTFQVSDVVITARHTRRMVLVHGLLSFMFNTVIVALTINAILDLKA